MILHPTMQIDPVVLQLAAAVADGSAIDWDLAEASAATDSEREVIRQLRALAAVGASNQPTEWGSFELRGEVGSGTFGTVYRAWDPVLERELALKLLHGAVLANEKPGAHEGRLLARIRHPNVVTVYGAEAHAGRTGIVMEFVTGRTLKDIVSDHGPLGADEAAIIGRDVCRALAAVHAQNVVHGDIKAQNVMREAGGRTILMDFGSGLTASADLTTVTLRGTPAYLAPELLEGSVPTPLNDIYSLGVLLFFLVTGDFPVQASSLPELRQRHAAALRRYLRDSRPDLPAAFVRVVDACLDPDPARRPATAGALESQLELALGLRAPVPAGVPDSSGAARTRFRSWPLAALALASIVGFALWGGVQGGFRRGATTVGTNSVVVLPFKNLTPDGQNDYLSEGITDDLAAHLSALRELRVIGGASVRRRFKDVNSEALEIGRDLGVATVLDGSVRRLDDRLRVVARLSEVSTGQLLWSEAFERDLKDILVMQSDIARRIAVALRGTISPPDEARFTAGRSRDPEAFEFYLKGRYYWGQRTEDGLNRSLRYFHDALARDPSYAGAHAGIADAYTALGTLGIVPRRDAFARAAEAAERAIALDGNLADSHAALAYARKNRFEWAAAEESFKRALALNPNHATAHHWYSIFLTQHGRFDEATTEIKTAIFLDPIGVGPRLQLASLLLLRKRHAEAAQQFEAVIQTDPGLAVAHRSLGQAYTYLGRYEEALTAFERAIRALPSASDDHEAQAALGYMHARAGRTSEALRIADTLAARHAAGEAVTASVAAVYAGLDEKERAFHWLSIACNLRDPEVGYLKVDPRWDSLRSDRRFVGMLITLGFGSVEKR